MSSPAETKAKPQLLIAFGPDWNRHPSTSQHLARQFLETGPVLWVETVGLRNPVLSWHDLKRAAQKITDFCTGRRTAAAAQLHPNLTVIAPTTLPFTKFRVVRWFNRGSVRRAVISAVTSMIDRLSPDQAPSLMISAPSQVDYLGQFSEAASIYLSMDDYSRWYGMDADHVHRMEAEAVERADGVVAVSAYLANRFSHLNKPVQVITQGVDVDHFASVPPCPQPGRFEVVYFGMLDDRLDQDLLVKAAQAVPEMTLRLIGPEVTDTTRLHQMPNIRIEPPIPYAQLPQAIATADAFILPFLINDLTISCSPLKLKEYLACGRTVISTALPEALQWKDVAHIAHSHDEFIHHLQSAARGDLQPNIARQRERMQAESWQAKAQELKQIFHMLATKSSQP